MNELKEYFYSYNKGIFVLNKSAFDLIAGVSVHLGRQVLSRDNLEPSID